MILLILGAGFLSNKIIITGKYHLVEKETDSEIMVTSEPNRADVYLGKNYIGTTPITLNVGPGDYQVTLKKLGYYEITESVLVNKAGSKKVHLILEPNTGRAFVDSNPSEADIFVDGIDMGTTPKLVFGLGDGVHAIRLTKEGFKDHNDFIIVNKNKEAKVFFSLEKQKQEQKLPLYLERTT